MDFDKLCADETKILTRHYTSGRSGQTITKVILHHNAGDLSIDGAYGVWQTREASAHYQVQSDGKIGQLVWDRDTAWNAGNWMANLTSIGIEHADCQSDPWRISDAALDAGAHLTAAICKYYKLGRPTWGKNVFGHSDFAATECPASLKVGGSQHDAYMARAQSYYDQMTGSTSTTTTQTQQTATQTISSSGGYAAKLIVDGSFGPLTVKRLQTKLQALGRYKGGAIDGSFGPMTKKALQEHLRYVKCYTGYIDGDFGTMSVKALQKRLNSLGCNAGLVDGSWGTMTTRALQTALNSDRL